VRSIISPLSWDLSLIATHHHTPPPPPPPPMEGVKHTRAHVSHQQVSQCLGKRRRARAFGTLAPEAKDIDLPFAAGNVRGERARTYTKHSLVLPLLCNLGSMALQASSTSFFNSQLWCLYDLTACPGTNPGCGSVLSVDCRSLGPNRRPGPSVAGQSPSTSYIQPGFSARTAADAWICLALKTSSHEYL
jgi:hypothetical protein